MGLNSNQMLLNIIVALVGTNMFMITSEVDKLALYAAEKKVIDVSLVEKLVSSFT